MPNKTTLEERFSDKFSEDFGQEVNIKENTNVPILAYEILDFFKAELLELAKEMEHKAHFSKLAGSKYDGYVYYKDLTDLIYKVVGKE